MSSRSRQFYPKADTALADDDFRSLVGGSAEPTSDQIKEAARSAGFVSDTFRPLASGTMNDVWRFRSCGKDFVIKVPRARGDCALAIEAAVSDLLARREVDHPRVRDIDESQTVVPFVFAISDFVEGPSMRDFDGDEAAVQKALPALADTFRSVHEVSSSRFGLAEVAHGQLEGTHPNWRDFLVTRLTEHIDLLLANNLASSTDVEILRLSAEPVESEPAPRLLHGDCGPHNIIVGPNSRPILIDWEDATFGDPTFELAMWATFNPARRWSMMLDTYAGTTTPPSAQFWRYFARITIAKVVVRTRLGYPDILGRPSRADRIRQALDGIRQSSS